MTLTLTLLHPPTPGNGVPVSRQVTHGTFSIGRGAGNDWVLPDPERHLSKRHCSVSVRDNFWTVTDLSTNGTFLNDDPAPIGNLALRDLRPGDRLRLGRYEIVINIDDAPAPERPSTLDSLSGFDSPALDPLGHADPFDLPAQSDHSPGIEDAFSPPRPVVLLGEDWDLANAHPSQSEPAGNISPDLAPMTSPAEPDAADLMTAFLRGAGLADARPADPVAAMHAFGAAFRALVGGLRETLVARAAVKSEFRIEQTMIRARGNNPLKFSASDDDALLALVGVGRRTDIGPAEAIAEAFHDIRLHELATMAAMQSATRDLLQALAPATLREQAEQGGGLNLLASQRKVRAWDAFEAAHGRLVRALSDSFDGAFGRSFARAYEQASREVGR